jgi:hypothetical protein
MNGRGGKAAGTRGFSRSLGLRAALPVLGCVLLGLAAAPALGSALSGSFLAASSNAVPVSLSARGGIGSFTPASVDPRLVSQISGHALGNGRVFRFTPAGMENRPDRAITVAVRISDLGARNLAQDFAVRSGLPAGVTAAGAASVRIAPTVYNLGMARGYRSFAAAAAMPRETSHFEFQRLDMPDLRAFSGKFSSKDAAASAGTATPSRLAPRLELDSKDRAGRAPRTYEVQGDYQVDLGGSYRLTRNIDVTAGVRYSPDRDRVRPLTDGNKDNQAVYVGTQFRF